MKKLLAIIVTASLLCSCAAERRLAALLKKHPELQYIDTVILHDTIVREQETQTTTFTLSELLAMDSIASVAKDSASNAADLAIPTVSAATDRSQATITPKGNNTFDLTSKAKTDTVIFTDTVYQPHYITEYKDKIIEVYKQKWWQEILTSIGIVALVILIIQTIIKTLTK